MVRARSGVPMKKGRARTRKLTKGFRASRHNLYRQSLVTLIRGRVYALDQRRLPGARRHVQPADSRAAKGELRTQSAIAVGNRDS